MGIWVQCISLKLTLSHGKLNLNFGKFNFFREGESVYSKCYFVFLANWKTKFKQLTTIFMFNKFLIWIFSAPHLFFIFIKNGKRNTVHFSFFIFMKVLKYELLKNIKINFMVILSIVCMLFKSKFMSSPRRFSAVQWSRGHQESAV